jgi:type I restriction enzyme R subunit
MWKTKNEDEREDFRSILQAFIGFMVFVSQLITLKISNLTQLYAFGRSLNKKTAPKKRPLADRSNGCGRFGLLQIGNKHLTQYLFAERKWKNHSGITTGSPTHTEEQMDWLSHIIQTINETYGINLTEDDKVISNGCRSDW